MATDPDEKARAKRRCNESHEAAGVTQEAAQEEVDAASQAHRLGGREARCPQPSPSCPSTSNTNPPHRQQHRCYHEGCRPPGNRLAHGTGTTGRGSQSSISHVQSGVSTGIGRAPRGRCHTHVHVCQGSNRLPEDAVPLPEWPARPDNWPTKGQLDDEATYLACYIDRIPVTDVEWKIQQSDSNGGFQCSDSESHVKYKVWPNNAQKSLHPSQKTWRKTTQRLVQVNEHERCVAGKAERLAKKMASMTVPSSAAAASSAADAAAEQKPKLKKRKGPDDSSTNLQKLQIQIYRRSWASLMTLPHGGGEPSKIKFRAMSGWTFQGMVQTGRLALLRGTQHRWQRSCARVTRACSMQEIEEQ